jgi:peptide/nickel transport system permease protein
MTVSRLGRFRSNPWLAYALRRLFALVITLVAIGFVSFILLRLIPGDPAVLMAGDVADETVIQRVRVQLGIDKPLGEQFITYVVNLSRGDLGSSFQTKQPVGDLIRARGAKSLELAAISLALVLLISLPLGMVAGALTREGRHKRGEVLFAGVTSVIGSIPEFLLGTFLAFVFAVWLRLLPVAGDVGWQSLVLPALAISLRSIAVLSRIVRLETLNTLASDYMRTARSKRLPTRLIYLRHALPNVTTAALTIGGLLFAGVVGGAVIVENVFNRPGLGTTLVAAIGTRDYPVVQGLVLVLGSTLVLVNATVDLILALIDPRSIARHA